MKKKIVVIGAGIGGLACGALLAKAGYDVEVLDRNPFIGGRCSSMQKDGYVLDHFIHAFPMGSRGPHTRVATALGEKIEFISQDPASLVVDGFGGSYRRFYQRLDIRPLFNRARMAIGMGVKPRNYLGGFLLFRDLLRADDAFIEANDDVTLREFLFRYTKDETMHRFMNVLSSMFFGISYTRASAGEFLWCFREMFNASDFGYVKGSTGAIPAAYLRGLEKFGGRLRLKTPVEKVLVENGKVTGVIAASGRIPADLVISNAGIEATVKMAGEQAVGAEYARFARGLEYSDTAVIIRFFLDKPVLKEPFLVYMPDISAERMFAHVEEGTAAPDSWIFMPVIDLWDRDLVPQGKQLVIAATPIPALATDEVFETTVERTKRRIYDIFPEMERHVRATDIVTPAMITATTGHDHPGDAIALAQIPGQVGKHKPSPITPVEGLYLVGVEAGVRGIGTEQAAASAELVATLVASRHPL